MKSKNKNWILLGLAAVVVVTFAIIGLQNKNHGSNDNVATMMLNDKEIKIDKDGRKYIVNPDDLLSGGPPKDGIPSIDNPKFVNAISANSWLDGDEPVLGFTFNGVNRAYPIKIMDWHEIVNDKIDGVPVLITYCPLCGTGIAFERYINGEEVEFGVSGKLFNSDLIMYDRKTDSYWQQLTGEAIVGELSGMELKKLSIDTVSWGDWKVKHPDTQVLSRNTGFVRPYGKSPYGNYAENEQIFFPVENSDSRLHPKTFVYGIEINGETKAYPNDEFGKVKILNDELGGKKLLVVQQDWTDAVRVFERGDRVFNLKDGKLVDNSGNEWSFDGNKGNEELEEIIGVNGFWFAWVAFHPDTKLFQA